MIRFAIFLLIGSSAFGALEIVASDTTPESQWKPVFCYVTGYQSVSSDIAWDWGDGNASYPECGITMLHYYPRPGTYTITVTETDAESNTYTDTETITVAGTDRKLPPRPATDPVVWLKFEDNLNDSSGNSNNGSVGGGTVAYASGGAENKCLDLTAADNAYVTIADSETLDGFTSGLTISYWAKQNSTQNASGYILSKASCYRSEITYSSVAKTWTFGANLYAGATVSPNINMTVTKYPPMGTSGWHHYVIVYNNTGSDIDGIANGYSTMYIDGVERTGDSSNIPRITSGNIANNSNALTIGAASGGWEGYVDEVKIWNTPLTKTQIGVGFESWHSPFYNREKQYIYYQIPGDITETATNTLTVTLTAPAYSATILNAKANLSAEESVLLDWSAAGANSYTLTAALKDGGGSTLETITEYFVKGYDGTSRISIDENKNLKVNGTTVFPIGSWIPNPTSWHIQVGRANYGFGHPSSHSPFDVSHWIPVINTLEARGQSSIGPVQITNAYYQNLPLATMDAYYDDLYSGLTDVSSLWCWCWDDEPDQTQTNRAGLAMNAFVPPCIAGWHYYGHTKDVQVPQIINIEGNGYIASAGSGTTLSTTGDYTYTWAYSKQRLGMKADIADIFCFDYYPYDWRTCFSATVDKWVTAIDNVIKANPYVPVWTFIESYDITDCPGTNAITQAELEHLVWLAIVHGCKGVCWFPQDSGIYSPNPSSPDEDITEPVYSVISDLKNVILSTAGSITCTADPNEAITVDTMVRVYDGITYIFAVRRTNYGDTGTYECSFSESGATTGTVAVYGEGRNLVLTAGVWTDTFAPNAVHIYSLTDEAPPLVNYTPVLTPVSNKVLTVNDPFEYSVECTDENLGDTLVYSLVNSPTWLSVNSSTGIMSGTPPHPGIWTVTICVTDGTASVTDSFQIEVTTGTYYFGPFRSK